MICTAVWVELTGQGTGEGEWMMKGNMAHTADQGWWGRRGNVGDGHTDRGKRRKITVLSTAEELCTECFLGCGDTDFKCVTGDSGRTVHGLD